MSIKSKRSVTQWTVWLVDHSKGGKHFQTVLKLRTTRWWRPIFEYLRNENDILQLIFPQIMTTFEHTDMYAKKNLSLYCTAQVSQTWKIPNIEKASNPQYQKSVENLQIRWLISISNQHWAEMGWQRNIRNEICKWSLQLNLRL